MKIVVAPDWRNGNPYLTMLEQSAKESEPSLDFHYANFDLGLFGLLKLGIRHWNADVIHLHWVTDLMAPIAWTGSDRIAGIKARVLALQAKALRLIGIKVIWTIHNISSHESLNVDRERFARHRLATSVSKVLLHSESALELVRSEYRLPSSLRAEILPHGNYDGQYPNVPFDVETLDQRLSRDNDYIKLLFFGAVRPYKGLEALIESLRKVKRSDIQILIAGDATDHALAERLVAYAETDRRVVLLLRRINDHEVYSLFAWADAVLVPFHRTLTSGSVVLAFTFGRPVISSLCAKVLDLIDSSNGYLFADGELPMVIEHLAKSKLIKMRAPARAVAVRLERRAIGRRLAQIYADPQV
jgi:beta-1,4-mannosyltransferase